jgi:hypothetical protein
MITGNKAKGTALELGMVKKAFKAGGWGFRAPGSGGFTPNSDVVQRTKLQEECTIPLSVRHVDFSFKLNYLNADYVCFFPEWKEVRAVEAKTVRPKKDKNGDRKNAKEVEVVAYYYLTEEQKKDGRYKGMMKKSDFCMELERTWIFARVMAESGAFKIPVRPYLHVRFIKSGTELFIQIPELLKLRTPADDVLKVVKNASNVIRIEWQRRT